MMMSNGSGFHAIKKIRDSNPKAKVIAISGDNGYLIEYKLGKLSIPFIYKSFNIEQILSIINA